MPLFKKRSYSNWITSIIINNNSKAGNINFIFCSDSYLLEINKTYLNHNYFTDIITFNNNQGNVISGDIYISIDTVVRNSNFYNVTPTEELRRVIIHGILHLLGFDDFTISQKLEMTSKEDEALLRFNTHFTNN